MPHLAHREKITLGKCLLGQKMYRNGLWSVNELPSEYKLSETGHLKDNRQLFTLNIVIFLFMFW